MNQVIYRPLRYEINRAEFGSEATYYSYGIFLGDQWWGVKSYPKAMERDRGDGMINSITKRKTEWQRIQDVQNAKLPTSTHHHTGDIAITSRSMGIASHRRNTRRSYVPSVLIVGDQRRHMFHHSHTSRLKKHDRANLVSPNKNLESRTLALLRYMENNFELRNNFKNGSRALELGASHTHSKDLHSCARILFRSRVLVLFGSFWSKVGQNGFCRNQSKPKNAVYDPNSRPSRTTNQTERKSQNLVTQ